MNITFLIGNGFDVGLGLKTRYPDFLENYLGAETKSQSIFLLKDFLSKKHKLDYWFNLELVLGESTAIYKRPSDFLEAYEDISNELRLYIEKQGRLVHGSDETRKIICNNLADPFSLFNDRDISLLLDYLNRFNNNNINSIDWNVNVLTYNYNYVFEELLNCNPSAAIFEKKNILGGTIRLKSVKHAHGDCDGTIVLGVNDTSQIANEEFRKQDIILNALMKSKSKIASGDLDLTDCANLIRDSNIICCYGLSLSLTDSYWVSLMAQRLMSNDCRLLLFEYDKDGAIEKILKHSKYRSAEFENNFKENLLSSVSSDVLSRIDKSGVKTHIFATAKKGLFDFSGTKFLTNKL